MGGGGQEAVGHPNMEGGSERSTTGDDPVRVDASGAITFQNMGVVAVLLGGRGGPERGRRVSTGRDEP